MDADATLEEGELIDDSDGIEDPEDNYTPLERPANYSSALLQARLPPQQDLESEDEAESSSETDSDSDTKVKRPKLKLKPRAVAARNGARKKYDIWSTHVQEDVLLENLVNCDVSQVDRSRNIETYPIPNRASSLPLFTKKNNKRTREDRNNSRLRLCKNFAESDNFNQSSGATRTILDVHATVEDSEDIIAKDIANKLYEEKEDLIRTIVTIAGKQKALELFKETRRIEQGGGMLIMNQTRRRTPGGVFLFLVKHDNGITRDQQCEIFKEERLNYKKEIRTKRKLKLQQIKEKIAATKTRSEPNIPELLSRAELCVQLSEEKDKSRRKSDDVDVKNPPPSPVTDGHDNSTDGMENINKESDMSENHRSIVNYGHDCLELDGGIDMDLF